MVCTIFFHRLIANKDIQPTERVVTNVNPSSIDISSTLTIDQCTLEDAGEVKAIAKNPVGEVSAVAPFIVQSKYKEFIYRTEYILRVHLSYRVSIKSSFIVQSMY